MRTLLTSYPFIFFRTFLFPLWGLGGLLLLYPSCELVQTGHALSQTPTATILLDFSDPNTRPGGIGGFRYHYQGESYLATYRAWEAWSCATSPDFFAAWDDDSRTVWLAHCPVRVGLTPTHLESITALTDTGTPLPIESWTPVPGAHEPTYQLTLAHDNYADIDAGTSTITLNVLYQDE